MVLKPLAPVLLSNAFSAIDSRAPSPNSKLTLSSSNIFSYCLTSEFLGSVKTLTRDFLSISSSEAMTGNLPTSSGMMPYLIKSLGSVFWELISLFFLIDWSLLNPKTFWFDLALIIFSMPSNAPAQINSMLEVSRLMNSWLGCFRPPWGGIDATVPSTSLSKACWTPSPETSLVIDGFSLFLEILSISSM